MKSEEGNWLQGFKYFACQNISGISVTVRGYANGNFEVRAQLNGPVLATIPVEFSNVWETYTMPLIIPDGVYAFYLTYRGQGNASLKSFTLHTSK